MMPEKDVQLARSTSLDIDEISDNASVGTFDEFSNHGGDSTADEDETRSLADVEAQPLVEDKVQPQLQPTEYDVDTRRKLFYLFGYFSLNLVLTIYNKAVLGGFAFPWLLTALHCSCVFIGCYGLLSRDYFKLTQLERSSNLVLVAFSVLFTLNIAISNVSL